MYSESPSLLPYMMLQPQPLPVLARLSPIARSSTSKSKSAYGGFQSMNECTFSYLWR
jgi:hypothetical protein